MANQRIRRSSMENLQLFDLDRWMTPIPPALPPPRHSNRSSLIEHSRALYDVARAQTDLTYAKTPMFTTIPRTNKEFSPRRVIGVRIPPEIIRANPSAPSTPSTPQTAEKTEGTTVQTVRESEDEDEDEENDQTSVGDPEEKEDDEEEESSSSSSEENKEDDDILDDDNDNQSIVEQIFNRDNPK